MVFFGSFCVITLANRSASKFYFKIFQTVKMKKINYFLWICLTKEFYGPGNYLEIIWLQEESHDVDSSCQKGKVMVAITSGKKLVALFNRRPWQWYKNFMDAIKGNVMKQCQKRGNFKGKKREKGRCIFDMQVFCAMLNSMSCINCQKMSISILLKNLIPSWCSYV